MSLFSTISVTCPACGAQSEMEAAESVNADRRPDLREAILDSSFQRVACPECGEAFRLEPDLNYLDVGRGQWISAFASGQLPDWVEGEDAAMDAFSISYGSRAGAAAQEVGETLRTRVVFGWPAMREKILLADLGLDDVTVELLKLALMRGLEGLQLEYGVDLRVLAADAREIEVGRQRAGTGEVLEVFGVPREIYDEIAGDAASWGEMRRDLTAGPFVDLQRLYMGEGRSAPADVAG